jgi:hypothetical protein
MSQTSILVLRGIISIEALVEITAFVSKGRGLALKYSEDLGKTDWTWER